MKHYVSYHNAEKMGYTFEESDPFSVGTKKKIDRIVGGKVWSIAGVGQPRKYFLGACFIVDDVRPSDQAEFDWCAGGKGGQIFNPLVPLNNLPWFAAFLESQNHFSLGLQVIKEDFAEELEALARRYTEILPVVVSVFPDELESRKTYREGAVRQVVVNAHERNEKARQDCVRHYGPTCFLCGFNFARVYGDVVDGLIHVHHLKPISEIGEEYVVDPIADLRPVCPNCHAVLHRRDPPYTLEDVSNFLSSQKGNSSRKGEAP
jgi:hypothetical protein